MKENKFEKVKEEERSGICNSIDCTKLSSGTLVECVQNPIMPLRLVVRAILVEHLNSRHFIALAGTAHAQRHQLNRVVVPPQRRRSMTLGDFLYRDVVQRETSQLKTVMDSTSARIGTLEEEVSRMKKVLLRECDETENGGVLKKGERWSTSSSRIPFDARMEDHDEVEKSSFSVDVGSLKPNMNGTLRKRFMIGLKNAFRVPNSAST